MIRLLIFIRCKMGEEEEEHEEEGSFERRKKLIFAKRVPPQPPLAANSLKRSIASNFPYVKSGENGGERRKSKRPVASIYQGCSNGTGVIVGMGLARAPIIDG